MDDKHRMWKWVGVLVLIGLAALVLWPPEAKLKGGIDLVGGTSLLFEIDTAGLTTLQRSGLPERVIAILKNRVDPNSQMNLVWRPIGNNRIEVQMPRPTENALRRRQAYEAARDKVRELNVTRLEVESALNAPPEQREARIEELVRNVPERKPLLEAAAEALDTYSALRGSDDVDAEHEKMTAYEEAVEAVLETSVNLPRLTDILELRTKEGADLVASIRDSHPSYRDRLDVLVNAHREWDEEKGSLEDPSDLKRLIRGAGVLEFRILAERDGTNPALLRYDEGGTRPVQSYVDQLQKRGPRAQDPGDPFRWFPIKDPVAFTNAKNMEHFEEARDRSGVIIEKYLDTYYVLAHDDPRKYGLTEKSGRWQLRSATPSQDYNTGRPAVQFILDTPGANKFGELTRNNLKRQLCIFLDGVAQSHATIQSQIFDRGQISGSFTQQEVMELVQTLDAGSLPARVKETPLMEKTIGPSLGLTNRTKGMQAAVAGLIAVAIFMVIYYLFAGLVANVALTLNLLFTLAIMAALEATFTLPGIAGLILTVGMAVDANVLIYERLREERDRGVNLKKSIKIAYEKAFSTIIDANLTTLITCVVLGYVGSEEIKGFAMTLGFGVVTSMFTALVVTRLIFSSMVSAGWLKSLPMLRLIGHPKINWLQLRTFFWPVSVVLTITGIVAFGTATATDKEALYDIEFLGGTSVQIETLPDVTLTDEDVTQLVTDKSGTSVVTWLLDAADALESAQVEAGTVPGEFVLTSDRLTGDQMAVLMKADPGTTGHPAFNDMLAREGVQTEGNRATFITRIREVEAETAASEEETPAEEKAPAVQVMTQDEFREAIRKAAAYARKAANDRLSVARVQYAQVAGEETGTPHAFDIVTVETSRELVQTAIVAVMGDKLRIELPIEAKLVMDPDRAPEGYFPIAAGTRYLSDVVPGAPSLDVQKFRGGLALVFDGIRPAQTTTAIANRIREIRLQPEYEGYAYREYTVFGLDDTAGTGSDAEKKYTKVALVVVDENIYYDPSNPDPWREGLAVPEREQAEAAFASEKTLRQVLQFDGQVAKRTQTQATVAMILACGAIVAYVWIRFGTMRYGLAAIIALVHDVSITLGLVTLADLVGLRNFRIDLAMIAALLTIIGYSLNDTIVIFDRIRENRGKLAHLTTEMINASINQCMSRTLLTSGTTLIVVFIMFVWGGPGVHGFSFALLIGVIVGTYSSVAIAAPLLASPRVLAAIVYGLIGLAVFGVLAQMLSTNVARGIAGLVVGLAIVLIVLWDYRSRYGIVPGTRPA